MDYDFANLTPLFQSLDRLVDLGQAQTWCRFHVPQGFPSLFWPQRLSEMPDVCVMGDSEPNLHLANTLLDVP